ncbi:MAG: signal peptidase I [Sporichthyaceae bacterium]
MPPRPTQRRSIRRSEELPEESDSDRRPVGQSSSLLRELPVLVFVALGLALLIKTFLVQAFFIPSDSMENTLLKGDRVLVNKFAANFGDVKRGEVVVFRDPGGWLPDTVRNESHNPILKGLKDVFVFVGLLPSSSEKDLIKRVIGVGGDKIVCCTDGKLTVNGVPLEEPYVFPGDKASDRSFSVTVPPNRLWVMGDHRSLSADSRVHMDDPGNGSIPKDNVVGRAFVLVWPLDRFTTLGVPATFKRDELDALPLSTSAAGIAVLVPLIIARRRRGFVVPQESVATPRSA